MPSATHDSSQLVSGVVCLRKQSYVSNDDESDSNVEHDRWPLTDIAKRIYPYTGQSNWRHCNWHGIWVSSYSKPGAFGRISHLDYDPDFPQAPIAFWVNWASYDPKDKRPSAGVHPVEDLKLLPVEPEPWHK